MTEPPNRNRYSSAPDWDVDTNRAYWIFLGITILVLLLIFWPVIPFLLFAVLVAYLTMPVVNALDRRLFKGRRRGAAIGLTFVLTIFFLLVAVLMFLPPLIEQTQAVLSSLPPTLETLISTPIAVGGAANETAFVPREWLVQQEFGADLVDFIDDLSRESEAGSVSVIGFVTGSLSRFSFDAFGFVTTIIHDLLSAIFFVFVLVYLWSGWENIVESFLQLPPEPFEDDVRRLVWELGQIWNSYLRGELIIAAVMGTLAWALAFGAGLPNPLFLGLVVGLLEFIPNIGPGLAAVVLGSAALVNPSANFPVLDGVLLAVIVLLVWVAMLQFQGAFLTPRVLGNSLRLHPIVVILAVMWGAAVGGIIGIIIAGPIVATIHLLVQYIYGRLTNRPAFPPIPTPPEQTRIVGHLWRVLKRFS